MMSLPVRVLLVEDEPLWQQGIQSLLASDPRFVLAGVADQYEQALALYREIQPGVVLLDWKIRGERDGLAVGEQLLLQGLPAERIIVISGSSPSLIPAHPFLFVPKSQIAGDLLPLMISVTIN